MAPLKHGLSRACQTRDEQAASDATTLTRASVTAQAASEYAQAGGRVKGLTCRQYVDTALRAEGMTALSAAEAEPMHNLQRTYNVRTRRWEYV